MMIICNLFFVGTPILSGFLNEYKLNKQEEVITAPKPLARGNITAKDLSKSATANECIEVIKKWADEVYRA